MQAAFHSVETEQSAQVRMRRPSTPRPSIPAPEERMSRSSKLLMAAAALLMLSAAAMLWVNAALTPEASPPLATTVG